MVDPIQIIDLTLRTIDKLYHLRLDLKNGPTLLEDIKSNVILLQMIIQTLHRQSQSKILSQENFNSLATSHRICNQGILEVQNILFIHCRRHGWRGHFDGLCFRFGPKEELISRMAALEDRMKSLMVLYEL